MWPTDYDLIIILVGLIAYVSSVLLGIFTFGDAIFFHFMWHVCSLIAPEFMSNTVYGDQFLLGATMMLSVRSGFVQPYFCYRSRKYLCPQLLWLSVPANTICTLIGTYILYSSGGDAEWLRYFLGFSYGSMALGFAVLTTRRALKNEANGVVKMSLANTDAWEISRTQLYMFGVACGLGGFLSGLVNVGGPPMLLMALYLDLPHPVVRGSVPFIFCVSLTTRFFALLIAGAYSIDAWMLYAAMVVGSFSGLGLGVELAGLLTHDTVAFSTCWVIFFAAVGTAGVNMLWTCVSAVICAASFAAFHHVRTQYRMRHQERAALESAEAAAVVALDDDAPKQSVEASAATAAATAAVELEKEDWPVPEEV